MIAVDAILLLALSQAPVSGEPAIAPSRPPAECADWRACRALALAADERKEYETFHDLAWRAMQKGPAHDPDLMFLVARAQAASNRPHDALVMLGRLAELGVAADASGEEFARTRSLPEWPPVEARIAAVAAGVPARATAAAAAPASGTSARSATATARPNPSTRTPGPASPPRASSPAPSPISPAPASTPAAAAVMPVVTLAAGPRAVSFSTRSFGVSGLGYDAVSRRYVLGDRLGRKLIVVDENSGQSIDLVRADSAGFMDISSVEIDPARGDLWVTTMAADGAGTLHRLQLASGRPLRAYPVATSLRPVALVDVAIGGDGSVIVLDATAPQLLVLSRGGTDFERGVRLDVADPVSIVAAKDEGIVFVAHRDGVSRVDMRARTASRVALPNGLSLDTLEQLRRVDNALIAVRKDADGVRHGVRLELNARGTAITRASRLEMPGSAAAGTTATIITVSDNELVSLSGGKQSSAPSSQSEFVVSRVPLR